MYSQTSSMIRTSRYLVLPAGSDTSQVMLAFAKSWHADEILIMSEMKERVQFHLSRRDP